MKLGESFFIASAALVIVLFNSCGLKPFPCYTASVSLDSIHVNQEVSFDATCSDSGKEFYWEFNTPSDTSTYIQKIVTRSFDSTGTVEIFLLVINGGKQASKKDYITILP